MKSYEYQILRYMPDRVSGEFVNVGIVLFQAESGFLKAGFARSISRVSAFFQGIDWRNLQRRLRHLENKFEDLSNQLATNLSFKYPEEITKITSRYLVKDDTSLQFSDVMFGVDTDITLAFDELYERFINNYSAEQEEEIRTDQEVWQKIYRPYFEKRGITNRLHSYTVRTAHDKIEFPFAWKNEVWHCYEPVSFNLKKSDSVKNKVYRWVGRFDELKSASESLDILLLTALPSDSPELQAFVKEKLNNKQFGTAKVSIVTQKEADQVAEVIQQAIIDHDTSH